MSVPSPDVRRLSFDRDPHAYTQARPDYPHGVYDLLTASCGLKPGCDALEVGAGSGQATAQLLAHGASVVAVEPGRRLANALQQRLNSPRLTVIHSDLETATLPDHGFDLAVAATSLHWVDLAVAVPKLGQALRPGGWLAAWWTVFQDHGQPPTAFREALQPLYQRYLPHEAAAGQTPLALQADHWTERLRQDGWFGSVEQAIFRWTHTLTPTTARLLWSTFPNIAELEPAPREAFLDALTKTVDRLGGVVHDPYLTVLYRTQRQSEVV